MGKTTLMEGVMGGSRVSFPFGRRGLEELGRALIGDVHRRVVTGYPAQVRACLEALRDEQVWWRPHPTSNSVGNLVLHTCGSTPHFLGRGLGGSSYRRPPTPPFAATRPRPPTSRTRRPRRLRGHLTL